MSISPYASWSWGGDSQAAIYMHQSHLEICYSNKLAQSMTQTWHPRTPGIPYKIIACLPTQSCLFVLGESQSYSTYPFPPSVYSSLNLASFFLLTQRLFGA